jgi:mRNA-degrading endonuclease RelE of RelBE toxin-antitoxin system
MYNIVLTPEAIDDLAFFRKFDQVRIVAALEAQLAHEPTTETRNRKRLRPNNLAEWVLRVDMFRIFYDVVSADATVKVIAVGQKKGNDLFIHGERYEL